MTMKEDVRQAGFKPGKSHRVQLFCQKWWKVRARHFQLYRTFGFYYFLWALQTHICSCCFTLRVLLNSSSQRHIFWQHAQTGAQLSRSSRLPSAFLSDQRNCAQAHTDHQVCFPGEFDQWHRKWWETTVDHMNSLNLWSGFNHLGQEQQRRLYCWSPKKLPTNILDFVWFKFEGVFLF